MQKHLNCVALCGVFFFPIFILFTKSIYKNKGSSPKYLSKQMRKEIRFRHGLSGLFCFHFFLFAQMNACYFPLNYCPKQMMWSCYHLKQRPGKIILLAMFRLKGTHGNMLVQLQPSWEGTSSLRIFPFASSHCKSDFPIKIGKRLSKQKNTLCQTHIWESHSVMYWVMLSPTGQASCPGHSTSDPTPCWYASESSGEWSRALGSCTYLGEPDQALLLLAPGLNLGP